MEAAGARQSRRGRGGKAETDSQRNQPVLSSRAAPKEQGGSCCPTATPATLSVVVGDGRGMSMAGRTFRDQRTGCAAVGAGAGPWGPHRLPLGSDRREEQGWTTGATPPSALAQTGRRSRAGPRGPHHLPPWLRQAGGAGLGRGRWASGLDERVEGVLLTLLCLCEVGSEVLS